jgi:hypothetical protein
VRFAPGPSKSVEGQVSRVCAACIMPAVTDPSERPLEAWETSAEGPYLTIRTGGPLDGLVTITATGIASFPERERAGSY